MRAGRLRQRIQRAAQGAQVRQRDLINNLGSNYFNEKKFGDSERLYREALKRFPDSDTAMYGVARLQQE